LPEEKEEDMLQTLELMDKLKDYNAFYVPLFFVPLENCVLMKQKGTEMDSLSKARWISSSNAGNTTLKSGNQPS